MKFVWHLHISAYVWVKALWLHGDVFLLVYWPVLSLWTADVFPVIASLPPKNDVCELERQNYFRDVKPFVLSLANQIKGYNTARATPCDIARWRALDFGKSYQNALEREFHDHNKVSCDVECCLWSNCFLSYVCDVGPWFRFIKYGSTWHKQNLDKIKQSLQRKERNIA